MFSSTHVKETEGLYPVSSIYSFILKSSDDWDRPKTGKVFSLTPVLGDSTNSSVTTIETYPVVIVYSGPTYDPLWRDSFCEYVGKPLRVLVLTVVVVPFTWV